MLLHSRAQITLPGLLHEICSAGSKPQTLGDTLDMLQNRPLYCKVNEEELRLLPYSKTLWACWRLSRSANVECE